MDDEFARALQARLEVLDDPEHVDPAREDLPARDLVLLALVGGLLVIAMVLWSYPA